MKLDDSRISSSDENGYTYIIGYNFLCFSVHIENIVPLVMFIEKFNVVLSFHNLKNVDINIVKYEIYLTFLLFSLLQITFNYTFGGTDSSTKRGELAWKKLTLSGSGCWDVLTCGQNDFQKIKGYYNKSRFLYSIYISLCWSIV